MTSRLPPIARSDRSRSAPACKSPTCTPNHAIQEISLGIHYNTGGHDLLNFVTNKEALSPVDGYLPVPEATRPWCRC